MRLYRTVSALIALLLTAACAPIGAQATRDSTWCSGCVPVLGQVPDSARDSVVVDTLWRHFTRTDTLSYRDSIVQVPVPPPPPPPSTAGAISPSDTAGFRLLGGATPSKMVDPGFGPVKVLNYFGQVYYDTGAHLAPFTSAYRYFYRPPSGGTCWGGTSPGFFRFETGFPAQRVYDLYWRGYYRWSTNFLGHKNTAKLMLLGWGTNGNQFILLMTGAKNDSLAPINVGVAWQGGGLHAPTIVKGTPELSGTGADGAWNIRGDGVDRGKWHKFEILSHAGPPGTRSSWIKVIHNDVVTVYLKDFDFSYTSNDPYVVKVDQAPVWGGGVSCTAPNGQTLWLTDVRFTGR